VATFGGCDFHLHLNENAASHVGLLRRLHEVSYGRIAFTEYAFVPRPRIAPWLLAAMRLGPLLDTPGRTVVTMDVHDDLALQNAQLTSLLGRLRREGRELCLTWWLAEDPPGECLLNAALPVPRLKSFVSDKYYHTPLGDDGGLSLHAHSDPGMMICSGYRLRAALLAAHEGTRFVEYLREYVTGAPSIPHGIEEMAWDAYLHEAGWDQPWGQGAEAESCDGTDAAAPADTPAAAAAAEEGAPPKQPAPSKAAGKTLMERTLFSVHRSLLAGRDTAEPFAHIQAASETAHRLDLTRHEFEVGKATFGISLPTCRHSTALDCAEDSVEWMSKKKIRPSG